MSAAFATLFLAHLIGDYPLQTAKLVEAKRTWPGLFLHVAIHLLVLLVICLPYLAELWPYLLALTVAHFAIDAFKNVLTKWRPGWNSAIYLFDQLIHFLSITIIAAWANTLPAWPIQWGWQRYAIAFLLATWVWFITELVLFHANHNYIGELVAQKWTRMAARALLLALFLTLGRLWGNSGMAATMVASLPYLSGIYGRRALLTDLGVTIVVAALLWLSN